MDAVGGRQGRHVEALDDLQDHQRRKPLPVRRAFEHLVPAIGGADRIGPEGGIRAIGEILFRVQAAKRVQMRHHAARRLAAIEALGALLRDLLQPVGQQGLGVAVARDGGLAIRQEDLGRMGIGTDAPGLGRPVEGHARRHRIARARIFDWPARTGSAKDMLPMSACSRHQAETAPGTVTPWALSSGM